MSELSDSGLPAVQRVVTGHDAKGRATLSTIGAVGGKTVVDGEAVIMVPRKPTQA